MAPSERSLKEQLAAEIPQALKAGQKVRLSALRMLSASVKNREVELGRELSDDEVREVAVREVKRRAEAIEAYQSAGREELAAREREEREVLQPYAPARLSEKEVAALLDQAVRETGAAGPGDMGKVMGFVMGRAKGRVDGAEVQHMVRERLAGDSA